MGIIDMWREARGAVLRREFDDAMARMRNANESARRAFLNNLEQTIDPILEEYTPASRRDRKKLSKLCRHEATTMWNQGDWPSALGLAVSCLNVESRFLPGADAAYVKAESDKLLAEARGEQ